MESIATETPSTTSTDDALAATHAATAPTASSTTAPSCVATFNSTVMDLVSELKGTFPELNDIIDERYVSLSPDDNTVMEWFEANAKDHHSKLTAKDASLFKEHTSLFLLPDINFSQLWKCKLTRANKNAIWKYLHVLLLLVSHHNMQETTQSVATVPTTESSGENATNTLSDNMKSTFEQWNKMLDDKQLAPEELQSMKNQSEKIMKLMETLHKSNEEEGDDEENEDDTASEGSGKAPTMEDLKNDPFVRQLENSKIAQFAKELTDEIDMGSLGLSEKDAKVESFQDVFGIMGKDPQKMFGLVKSVGDKIQSKMKSGDIQQSELLGEAQQLMRSMQTSDTFKQMFKGAKGKKGRGKGAGFDPHQMFQEMSKHIDPAMMQQAMSMMGNMQGVSPMAAGGGATRARLQQKVAHRSQEGITDTTNKKQKNTKNKKKNKKQSEHVSS